jgi:hypothetical protein
MLKKFLCIGIILCPFLSRARQSREDFERSLDVMVKQGQIRREGNKIIFLNQRTPPKECLPIPLLPAI